jgi:3',5'-cyclic AMP phosphodiesterase CpdA
MVKVAIVSDLHCHPSDVAPADSFLLTDMLRSPAKSHPIQSLLDMIVEDQITADILLVGGDVTNKVNQQGIISGWSFVKEIAQALQVDTIAATVGNHDIDSRRTHCPDPFHVARSFSPSDFPVASEGNRLSFWQHGFFTVVEKNLTVLVLNSVLSHHTDEEAKRGSISTANLENLERHLSQLTATRFRIALVHHHPLAHENLGLGYEDLMVNGSLLLELLARFDYDLVVHGHKHYPRLGYAPGGSSAPTVFAAGSLCAIGPKMLSNTRNLFHVVHLEEVVVEDCAKPGKIYSWEYNAGKGWSPPAHRSADFPPVAGFGCRASAKALAGRTALLFEEGSSGFRKWTDIQASIPQIDYLLPSDLKEYSRELRERFGLMTHPELPEPPAVIGRP